MAESAEEIRSQVPPSIRASSRTGRVIFRFPVPLHTKVCVARAPVGKDADPVVCNCGNAPQKEAGYSSIGLIELTADEEMQVLRKLKGASVGDGLRSSYDLAKASLAEVNGRAVSQTDESIDLAFNNMRPRGRVLLLKAFNALHTLQKDVERDFLEGMTAGI